MGLIVLGVPLTRPKASSDFGSESLSLRMIWGLDDLVTDNLRQAHQRRRGDVSQGKERAIKRMDDKGRRRKTSEVGNQDWSLSQLQYSGLWKIWSKTRLSFVRCEVWLRFSW